MDRESTTGAVDPIELPPPPDPDPCADPVVSALLAEVVKNGYERTSVENVVQRAGISREEFDRRFGGLEDCTLDCLERLIAEFTFRVGTAFNGQSDWPSALRAAAYETADLLDRYPLITAFGMLDVLKMPGEMARVRREGSFIFCAQMIDRGRWAAPDPEAVPESASVFAIGAITQLLTHRLQEAAEIDFHAVVPEMMSRVVGIYLGAEAAEAEWAAERPRTAEPLPR